LPAAAKPYLNLAVGTEAVFLVSRDNDLLDLMTDFTDEAKDSRRRYRRVNILNPVEFLEEEMRKLESEGGVSKSRRYKVFMVLAV